MPINQQFHSQTLHLLMEPNPSNQPPWFINNQHPLPNFNLNHDVQDQALDNEATITSPLKEPMFEKPLTPSDVGKLNRLVIPKQYAEKYFPLGGGLDSGGDKGMLLSFEDELGKCWEFRYSYWNSSQSYVLTKGWSRYVKEKQLDAGDVVLFERHRRDVERLFIGWRRKGSDSSSNSGAMVHGSGSGPWSRGLYPPTSTSTTTSPSPYPSTPSVHQQHGNEPHHAVRNSKRTVRLFGVNLECGLEESEPSTPDNSSSSLSSQSLAHPYQFYPSDHQLPSFHTHMVSYW